MSLQEVWAAPLDFCLPVRWFAARKGQRHLSGQWWSATTGGQVGFGSWIERDRTMLLDFDTSVVGIASQPFWLRWSDDAGAPVAHAPDMFARRSDGSALVLDCRPMGGANRAMSRSLMPLRRRAHCGRIRCR